MRSAAWSVILALLACGCLQADTTPNLATAATPTPESPERSFLFTNAVTWRFILHGPDNFIGVNATTTDTLLDGTGTEAALLFIYAEEEMWDRMMVFPGHPSIVRGPSSHNASLTVNAADDHWAGSMSISYYGPEWWNRMFIGVAMNAGPDGGVPYQLSLSGKDVEIVGEMEQGPARFIPSEAWEGERFVKSQWVPMLGRVGAHVGYKLSTSWETTNATVAVFQSFEQTPTVRYDEVRLASPTSEWYYNRVSEWRTGMYVRIGPKEDNASLDPRGFLLASDETSWRMEVNGRAAPSPAYDAVLVADLRPAFGFSGTRLL